MDNGEKKPVSDEDNKQQQQELAAGAAADIPDVANDDTPPVAQATITAAFSESQLAAEDRDRMQDDKFAAVEQEFERTMAELGDNEAMARFRTEYEKLHRTLLKSRDNEKKLLGKCKELNEEMLSNAGKLQAAVKTSQTDRTTIANMKKEIKKAWQMVETVNEKEARSKESLQQLKTEVANAQKILEQGAGLNVGQENSVNELIRVW